MQHLYPQPRPETVERIREIFREKYGKEVTQEEAWEFLYAVIRFLWLSGGPADPPKEEGTAEGETPAGEA